MYKQCNPVLIGGEVASVIRIEDRAVIPFDPDNTDYQTFKKDIAEGKTLQDADGNKMTAEAAQEYLASLP